MAKTGERRRRREVVKSLSVLVDCGVAESGKEGEPVGYTLR
jgi:hypothetical protein